MKGLKRVGVIGPLACAMAACASIPVVAPPRIVTITQVRYVPMPAADLLPCTTNQGPILNGADVIAAWQRALAALAICNTQVGDLKRLGKQATSKPPVPEQVP